MSQQNVSPEQEAECRCRERKLALFYFVALPLLLLGGAIWLDVSIVRIIF